MADAAYELAKDTLDVICSMLEEHGYRARHKYSYGKHKDHLSASVYFYNSHVEVNIGIPPSKWPVVMVMIDRHGETKSEISNVDLSTETIEDSLLPTLDELRREDDEIEKEIEEREEYKRLYADPEDNPRLAKMAARYENERRKRKMQGRKKEPQ